VEADDQARVQSDGHLADDVPRVGGMTHNLMDPATITVETAAQIRTWRVDEDFSRRAVAQAASELWGSAYGSNRLYGDGDRRSVAVPAVVLRHH
jgi:hypothetical protein